MDIMTRPLRIEYPGAFYHITSSGNERRDIFKDEQDFEKFLTYLETATQRYGAVVHIYCLMSNHYHLLLETPMGNLSQVMRHINGAYTSYFNAKMQRAGHLLQGRYKAILIDADEYARELSRYIHLHPVRVGIAKRPEEYQWSSYQCYIGEQKIPKWLTVDFILGYFGDKTTTAKDKYREFVNTLIDKEDDDPLKKAVASTILGGISFVNEIRDKYLKGKKIDRNLPALAELKRIPIEEIVNEVEVVFSEDKWLQKKAAIYLCHRYSGRALREIGSYFDIGESAVSQASRRFIVAMNKDKKLSEKMKDICNRLRLHNV
jgi:REP element-mobilizing transposase RayT